VKQIKQRFIFLNKVYIKYTHTKGIDECELK
jgi:hypothetical protein